MVVYEVNLTVEPDVAEEYGAWLAEHVREMLALPGFHSAEWLDDVDYDQEEGAGPRWTIHYRLGSHDDFLRYEREHAKRMRQEGLDRFGTRFTATRRILEVRDAFGEGAPPSPARVTGASRRG